MNNVEQMIDIMQNLLDLYTNHNNIYVTPSGAPAPAPLQPSDIAQVAVLKLRLLKLKTKVKLAIK